MKKTAIVVIALLAVSGAAWAQSAGSQNPVIDTTKSIMARYAKNIIAAAEQMPADAYSFKPTPQQQSFGHIVEHIAGSNYFLCSTIAGTPQPQTEKVTENDSKEKLVKAMKDSFEYCGQAIDKANDSQLGQEVTLFGGRKAPKAAAVIALDMDFADHYAGMAQYLRLKGMLPPSAQQQQPAKPADKK